MHMTPPGGVSAHWAHTTWVYRGQYGLDGGIPYA